MQTGVLARLRVVSMSAAAMLLIASSPSVAAAQEIAAPPTSDDFRYPDSKDALVNLRYPKAAKGTWMGTLVTDDDPDAVVKWYGERLGLSDQFKEKAGTYKGELGKRKQTLMIVDWNHPRKKGEDKTKVFQATLHETGGKRGDFVLTLTVHHRADVGKSEILVSFVPLADAPPRVDLPEKKNP